MMRYLKGIKERIAYTFDKVIDRGTFALILFLLAVTLIVSAIAGVVLVAVHTDWSGGSITHSIWKSFLLTLDPGNQLAIEGNFMLVAITAIMTFTGIAFITTLIGIINSGITNKYEKLRQGTSKVIEKRHTVILGFNDNVYRIVSELMKANADKKWRAKKPRIVILGDEDVGVMEQKIRDRLFKTVKKSDNQESDIYGVYKKSIRRTKLIYRKGIPSNPADLEKCSIETSQTVIINEYDDSEVIRIILAVSKILENHHSNACEVFAVASINDIENKDIAYLAGKREPDKKGNIDNWTPGFIEVLCFDDIISKIIAQTLYQPGLSEVYLELFDFDGNEIYMKEYEELFKKNSAEDGRIYSEVLNLLENATVIGVKKQNEQKAKLCLNMNEKIERGDKIIYIAQNKELVKETEPSQISQSSFLSQSEIKKKWHPALKGIVVFGFNKYLKKILEEWKQYFEHATPITIFVKTEKDKDEVLSISSEFNMFNVSVDVCICYNLNMILEKLKKITFEHVLILSDLECDVQKSDTETMALLTRLRYIKKENENKPMFITSQMLDIKNRDLVQSADVNDFVVSSDIISLMMAQVSQNKGLTPIFEDLLNSKGAEIYLKPTHLYNIPLNTPDKGYSIHNIINAVKNRNEIFIGFKKKNTENQTNKYEITINPDKEKIIKFSEDDMIIVISESWN